MYIYTYIYIIIIYIYNNNNIIYIVIIYIYIYAAPHTWDDAAKLLSFIKCGPGFQVRIVELKTSERIDAAQYSWESSAQCSKVQENRRASAF